MPIEQSDIWFSDGSIVLEAEGTQFKVHQSLLARNSQVFAGMFTIPTPEDQSLVDRCPVVLLHDSKEDVRHMLLALYDRSYAADAKLTPFDLVRAMIRMGRKYEIEHLRNEGVGRIKREVPGTLEGIKWLWDSNIWISIFKEPGLVTMIVNCAWECDIQTVLPMAYLLCTLSPMNHLYDIQTQPKDQGSLSERLSADALHICIAGREKVITAYGDVFQFVDAPRAGNPDCQNPTACRERALLLSNSLWRPRPKLSYLLLDWNGLVKEERYLALLCPSCLSVCKRGYEQKRNTFWEQVPGYFELPGWEDLKDFGG
ncbi:hypothetical protein DFP72DRAFT_224824 [Ephemerocybe angulata]|uniref:BTB domain-containing protein n=1 Tax=Ephemerocybe angulata TaxID=980116 RepID=A0A8H6I4I9_9AGAR|nr:hypothetical protein DFP72DRAFT_224824 [Tulosesus angulatus]